MKNEMNRLFILRHGYIYKAVLLLHAVFGFLCAPLYANEEQIILSDLSIPSINGQITERHIDPLSTESIIILQDIHTSYTAQRNSAAITRLLCDKGVGLIGLEGASGAIQLNDFTAFPDKEVRSSVCDYFVRSGYIGGIEYYCVAQGLPDSILWGVEDKDLYKLNLNAFLCSLNHSSDIQAFISSVSSICDTARQNHFSPDLLNYDNCVRSFYDHNGSFLVYLQDILHWAGKTGVEYNSYANIALFNRIADIERTCDFLTAEQSLWASVSDLKTTVGHGDRDVLDRQAALFKTGRISAGDFIANLTNLADDYGYSFEPFPHLIDYITYIKLNGKIDQSALIEETRSIERLVYGKLVRTRDEQEIHDISAYIRYVHRLSSLQMTRADFSSFAELNEELSPFFLHARLAEDNALFSGAAQPDWNPQSIAESIDFYIQFYLLAATREAAMVQNLMTKMSVHGFHTGMLVAGGFHLTGLRDELRKRNVSYVVISPSIGSSNDSLPYISMLENAQTPFEEFISANTGTLKAAAWFAMEPLAYTDRKEVLTTKMKTLFSTAALYNLYEATAPDAEIERTEVERKLEENINILLARAGYDSLLRVHSIVIQRDYISASIAFKDRSGNEVNSVFMKAKRGKGAEASSALALLESITLDTGVTFDFFDYAGYVQMRANDFQLQRTVLGLIRDGVNLTELTNIFSLDTNMSETVNIYLKDFIDKGIVTRHVETGKPEYYSLTDRAPVQLLAKSLSANMINQNVVDSSIIIPLDSLNIQSARGYDIIQSVMFSPQMNLVDVVGVLDSILSDEEISSRMATHFVPDLTGKSSIMYVRYDADKLLTDPYASVPDLKRVKSGLTIPYFKVHTLRETLDGLFELARMGDPYAEKELLGKYDYIARTMASKYLYVFKKSPYIPKGIDFQETYDVAREGLLRAIRSNKNGATFKAYAYTVVQNAMRRHISSSSWITQSIHTQMMELIEAANTLKLRNGRSSSDQELADYLNTSIRQVRKLRTIQASGFVSLEQPITKGGSKNDEMTLADIIPLPNDRSPEEILLHKETWRNLEHVISLLTDREREIVRMYYYDEYTYDEISEIYGVSRQRINQILEAALEKMRALFELLDLFSGTEINQLKTTILNELAELSDREREMILWSFVGADSDSEQAYLFNVVHPTAFRRMRGAVYNRMRERVLASLEPKSPMRLFLKEKESEWQVLVRMFLPNRNEFFMDIFDDYVSRNIDEAIDMDDIRPVLKTIIPHLSFLEQEIIFLKQYEGKTLHDIAPVVDRPEQKLIWVQKRLNQKLESIFWAQKSLGSDVRSIVAKAIVESLNEQSLRDRDIFTALYLEDVSAHELAEQYGVTHSGMRVIRLTILEKLRVAIKQALLNSDISWSELKKFQGYSDTLDFTEMLVSGLVTDIDTTAISDEEIQRPTSLVDALAQIARKKYESKLDDDFLVDILNEYADLMSERDKNIILLRYTEGLSMPELSDKTGITVNTLTPILYRNILPSLEEYLRFYEVFNDETLYIARTKMAEAITRLPSARDMHMLVYFAYDHLTIDEIADRLGIETNNNNYNKKFQMALRAVRDEFIQAVPEEGRAYFLNARTYTDSMRYFLRGLQYSLPRSYFQIPELQMNEPAQVDTLYYNEDFLREVYDNVGLEGEPSELDLRELNALLEDFNDQQWNVMYLKFVKKKVRTEIAEELDIPLSIVDGSVKYVRRTLRKHYDFLNKFTPEERAHIRKVIAESINKNLILPENKQLLAALYYDNLSAQEIVDKGLIPGLNRGAILARIDAMITKIYETFMRDISEPLRGPFAGTTVKMRYMMFTLKTDIPLSQIGLVDKSFRERNWIPLQGKETPPNQVEESAENIVAKPSQDKETETRAEEVVYTGQEVNDIFQKFHPDPVQVLNMKQFLTYSVTAVNPVMPHPLVINRNAFFHSLRVKGKYLGDEQRGIIMSEYGLNALEVHYLENVLIKSGFLAPRITATDVIVVDIDEYNIPKMYNNTASTVYLRGTLQRLFIRLNRDFQRYGRNARVVIYSSKYNAMEIESFLGKELTDYFTSGNNMIAGNELLQTIDAESREQAMTQLFLSLMNANGGGSANVKVYSQNDTVHELARKLGFMRSDREQPLYMSLVLWGKVHPHTAPDSLFIGEEQIPVFDLVNQNGQGYFSLAGEALGMKKPTRNLTKTSLLDQSL